MKVVVIGAGIVGISAAIWLRRFGAEVVVIDRDGPAAGASFGNAGVLAASAVAPAVGPGTLRRVPGMLMDRDAPLFLRWRHAPRLWPWARRLVPNTRTSAVRRITGALAPLVTGSVEEHESMTEGLNARAFLRRSDYAYAYAARRDFEADRFTWGLKREAGIVPELIEGDAVRDYDPALGKGIGCLAVTGGHGYVTDPAGYVQALAADLQSLGGEVRRGEARDLAIREGRVAGVVTENKELPCDRVVVAGGIVSKALLERLGLSVPMESERGYHLHFDDSTGGPSRPVMVASGAFVATPMAGGLRCAGTLELGGTEAGPSRAPLELIRRQARRAFPALAAGHVREWMGHRPATPDSLPLLGEVGRTGIVAATGHHHVGLTAGPVSGRIAAQIVTGRAPNIDLSPYRPERFSRRTEGQP